MHISHAYAYAQDNRKQTAIRFCVQEATRHGGGVRCRTGTIRPRPRRWPRANELPRQYNTAAQSRQPDIGCLSREFEDWLQSRACPLGVLK